MTTPAATPSAPPTAPPLASSTSATPAPAGKPGTPATLTSAKSNQIAIGAIPSSTAPARSSRGSTNPSGTPHTPSRTYTIIRSQDSTGATHIRLAWITVRDVATKKFLGYVDLDDETEENVRESLGNIFREMDLDKTGEGKKFLSKTSSDPMTFTIDTKNSASKTDIDTTVTFKKGDAKYEIKDTATENNKDVRKLRETLLDNIDLNYVDKTGKPFNPFELLEKEETDGAAKKKDAPPPIKLDLDTRIADPTILTTHLENIANSQERGNLQVHPVIDLDDLRNKETFKNLPNLPYFIPVITNGDRRDPEYMFLYWDKPSNKLYRCGGPGIKQLADVTFSRTFSNIGRVDYSKLPHEQLRAFCDQQDVTQFIDSPLKYSKGVSQEVAGLEWFKHLTSSKDLGKNIFGSAPTKDQIEIPSDGAVKSSSSSASSASTTSSSPSSATSSSSRSTPVRTPEDQAVYEMFNEGAAAPSSKKELTAEQRTWWNALPHMLAKRFTTNQRENERLEQELQSGNFNSPRMFEQLRRVSGKKFSDADQQRWLANIANSSLLYKILLQKTNTVRSQFSPSEKRIAKAREDLLFIFNDRTIEPATPEQKRWLRGLRGFLVAPEGGAALVNIREFAQHCQNGTGFTQNETDALNMAERALSNGANDLRNGDAPVRHRWIQTLANRKPGTINPQYPHLLSILTTQPQKGKDDPLDDLLDDMPVPSAMRLSAAAGESNLQSLEGLQQARLDIQSIKVARKSAIDLYTQANAKKEGNVEQYTTALNLNKQILEEAEKLLEALASYQESAPQAEQTSLHQIYASANKTIAEAEAIAKRLKEQEPAPEAKQPAAPNADQNDGL